MSMMTILILQRAEWRMFDMSNTSANNVHDVDERHRLFEPAITGRFTLEVLNNLVDLLGVHEFAHLTTFLSVAL